MQTVAVLEASDIEVLKKIAQSVPSLVERLNEFLSSPKAQARPVEWFTQQELSKILKISESSLIAKRNNPGFPYLYEKFGEQTVRFRLKDSQGMTTH